MTVRTRTEPGALSIHSQTSRAVGRFAQSRVVRWLTAITLFITMAMAIPIRLAAQEQQKKAKEHSRYIIKDLGTLGGPNSSLLSQPVAKSLNDRGRAEGTADTPDRNTNGNAFLNGPFVQHAFSWQDGVLTDLGTLPGGVNSLADWINDTGMVAGASEDGLVDPLLGVPEVVAVLWNHGEIVKLGTLDGGHEAIANAINNRGQAVGPALNTIPDEFSLLGLGTQTRAFLWENGLMRDLGTLGGPDAFALYVNERGQIAGFSYTNSTPNPTTGIPTIDPFLWESGRMLDLGSLGGTLGFANALNDRGEVVGSSDLPGDQIFHPFLSSGGIIRDLGTLGGDSGEAFWINDVGEVVGRADVPGSQAHHAFLWKQGVMTDLGTPDGDMCSTALALNARTQVVGDSGICGVGGHAFLWENGSIVDLSDLFLPGPNLRVIDVGFINDRAEIAAQGVLPNGDHHAVLLIPCDREHADTDGCENDAGRTITVSQHNAAFARPVPAGAAVSIPTPMSAVDRLRDRLAQRHPYRRFAAGPQIPIAVPSIQEDRP